jgi:Double zinc ribbon
MRCPSCGFENPSGMKYCGQCATPLTSPCPRCGLANPPGFALCGQCAMPLTTALSMVAPSPQTYTPAHMAEKILTSKAALEGERKQVTVLFIDVSEVTTRAKHLGTLSEPDTVGQSWAMLADRARRWTEHDR